MGRLGSSVDLKMCDKLKGRIDQDKNYSSSDLINFFRHQEDFLFEDLVSWIFGRADWAGDSAKEHEVVGKLNQFIASNPINGVDIEVISCSSEQCKKSFWIAYGVNSTAQQREVYKQALCDIIISN